ncbi:hypothetical protein [Aureibacter tunicatorum]|uniref:Uncharacterized protein n=1 Tax=Aureibacter tunicatorum TaxID=866807 RepID=A0AAE3XRI1_9BACT|nr:hypothetical protein [Aureibacter tunicatorum]MDR6240600.1 hypothetical protein [Aureibacter tunicatorum]BDD06539.1 hypothetical protein AUTU_40220 [Aureibacter tunicatorum]
MNKQFDPALNNANGAAIAPLASFSQDFKKKDEVSVEIELLKELVIAKSKDPINIMEAKDVIKWLKDYKVKHVQKSETFVIITKTVIKSHILSGSDEIKDIFISLNQRIQVTRISSIMLHERKGFKSIPSSLNLVVSFATSKAPQHIMEDRIADAIGESISVGLKFGAGEVANKLGVEAMKSTIRHATARLIGVSAARALAGASIIAAIAPAAGAAGVIIISIAIGVGIDYIDKKLKITEKTIDISNNIGDSLSQAYQYLTAKDGFELLKSDFKQSDIFKEIAKATTMSDMDWYRQLTKMPIY